MEWNGMELRICSTFLKASFYGKLAAKHKRNKAMF